MVGDDDEQGVLEPGLRTSPVDEVADREIGVLDGAESPTGRRDVDAAGGIGVRAVIGRCHDVRKERIALRPSLIQRAQGLAEQHLVRHPPDVFEDDGALVHVRPVDHLVAVAPEIGIHVVEVAVPAVEKVGLEALRAKHFSQRGEVLVLRSADNGLPGDGGRSQRQRLQPPDRACSRRIGVREQQSLLGDRIEPGRQPSRVAVCAKK